MKNNNKYDYTFILLLCLSFLILLIINSVGLNNKLKECKQSDTFYQEYSAFYVKEFDECEIELNECNSYLDRFDKYSAYLNSQVQMNKDRCPICPTDEVCIKVVKENKFQCINRELFGGN